MAGTTCLVADAHAASRLNLQNSFDLSREQAAKARTYADLSPLVSA